VSYLSGRGTNAHHGAPQAFAAGGVCRTEPVSDGGDLPQPGCAGPLQSAATFTPLALSLASHAWCDVCLDDRRRWASIDVTLWLP
jgi:hypothetical protein